MRKLIVGLIATAGIAIATPALTQSVYLEGPGVGVRVGPSHRYHRSYEYDRPRYRKYRYDSYARGCRTITIRRDDGSVRRIRRCG
jgi:hypothetical protein